jgi:hypothetical protein
MEIENGFKVEGPVRFRGPFWYEPMGPDAQELARNKGRAYIAGYRLVVEENI